LRLKESMLAKIAARFVSRKKQMLSTPTKSGYLAIVGVEDFRLKESIYRDQPELVV
jgi:hypothetical protein